MKRIIPALAVALALFGGCTDSEPEFVIAGLDNPICSASSSSSTTTTVPLDANVDAFSQQIILGELSVDVGLDALNDLSSPDVLNATGASTQSPNRDDITLTAANITVADLSGTNVATETLPVSAYILHSSKSTITMDIMGKPLADAIRAQMTFPKTAPGPEKLLVTITLSGNVVSGGSITTNPYTFPLNVNFDAALYQQPFPGSSATQGVAVLPDGGYWDMVIQPDGTEVLGDPGTVQSDGSVTIVDAGHSYADTAIGAVEELAAAGSDGGLALPPGANPCN